MKIYRDGKEIELTAEELRMTYKEVEFRYYVEDVKSRIDDMELDCDLEESDYNIIAQRFYRSLCRNDSYWEDYWCTMENAIKDYIKEDK